MSTEEKLISRSDELGQRMQAVATRVEILGKMRVEISANSGRNPMSHDVRQRLMFDINVEEMSLRAEYFVLRDMISVISASEQT